MNGFVGRGLPESLARDATPLCCNPSRDGLHQEAWAQAEVGSADTGRVTGVDRPVGVRLSRPSEAS